MKLYICKHCGNIIKYEKSSGVKVMCCGEKMSELIPSSSDGALEKHVPVVNIEDREVFVKVGEVEHPMLEEHYIEWIEIETTKGSQRVKLNPGDKPEAKFTLSSNDEFVAAYTYCNLHGFWKNN